MSPTLIIGAVLLALNAATFVYAWDADRAFVREKTNAELYAAQRDQYAKGLTQCRLDIAERNRVISGMAGLSDERRRLCAQRGPQSGCCKADGECKP